MACIASSFTGSVAALKATKVTVRSPLASLASRATPRVPEDGKYFGFPRPQPTPETRR
jgi:hypothetical protein